LSRSISVGFMMQSSSRLWLRGVSSGAVISKAVFRASKSAVAPKGLSRPYNLQVSIALRRKAVFLPLKVRLKIT
jgi:hypothetical protein